MTTTTTPHTVLPIAPAVLVALRVRDDAGRPALPYEDPEGGAPLRCCLRRSRPGERIALVSYAPLRRWAAERGVDPGAYDEQGPVFVHAADCGGPAAESGYPFAHPGALRAARRYDAAGHILGGRVLTLAADPDAQIEAALTEAFADPAVALVHVRAVEFGCFLFEARRRT
ncbi:MULTISPECIES: DUF1203 domain-containing protein [unclassified Streptomyces]|uniref:DUF1203 domain-containing protein n=1 Tax=unclassified Streptomyces TaxID=2593676 RepID=UPI00224D1F86|nr:MULTISPECIES: DUF1203 domain-containing protein [unclassified Streptomyces]MCX4525892.1 DUF1203 domain-containing protein [Streptomyces sp. NBC_01551]MCX4543546.1 DUF1203 domain-containing protein [Streptomyces sp. NBC_01565]